MARRKIALFILSIAVTGFSPLVSPFPRLILADEITVSGNGSDSSSSVSVAQQTNTTVQQTNQVSNDNNVTTNAETGNNSSSDNNGDASIKTGDASVSTEVVNQANTSTVDTGNCCQQGENTITVSSNGSGSTNTVNNTNTSSVTTTTTQTATITTSIHGTAQTGGNRANDNQGSVAIVTGNISHLESIKTGPINVASVTVGVPSPLYIVKIKGNGSNSTNIITNSVSTDVRHEIFNTTNIFNDSFWNLITGNNLANRNNGDVVIKTGDISSEVSITNEANESTIKDTCCQVKPSETPTPTPTQPTPTPKEEGKPGGGSGGGNGGGGNGGGSGSSSASTGSSGGSILPVTGGSWFVFILLGNIVMLFLGMILRLRSGRSPSFAYNFVL